jgi:hypothetical protein
LPVLLSVSAAIHEHVASALHLASSLIWLHALFAVALGVAVWVSFVAPGRRRRARTRQQ